MYKFKKILVCLDYTEMDYYLIDYARFIVKTFKAEKLTFIHVMEAYNIPEELTDSLEDPGVDLKDLIREELKDRVDSGISGKDGVKPELVVEEGLTTEKILQYSRKDKTDLCILGKKAGYSGKGGVARKMVGLLPCSVLVVSETSRTELKKLLVRMDFSDMAGASLLMARSISEYSGASIECHHVYKLPLNYFPRNNPDNVKRMKSQLGRFVKREYEKFIKKLKIDDPPQISYSMEIHTDESQLLYHHAIKNNVDLILTGTKIKSPLANLILDSTSEKLVGAEKNIPVMVVKDKNKSANILKSIFG